MNYQQRLRIRCDGGRVESSYTSEGRWWAIFQSFDNKYPRSLHHDARFELWFIQRNKFGLFARYMLYNEMPIHGNWQKASASKNNNTVKWPNNDTRTLTRSPLVNKCYRYKEIEDREETRHQMPWYMLLSKCPENQSQFVAKIFKYVCIGTRQTGHFPLPPSYTRCAHRVHA